MDPSLRNAKGMQNHIEQLQANLIRRFTNLVNLAEPKTTDRGVSAVTQYQIRAETAALIRATEEVQTLIRQMQEMWLFGQLNTLGQSQIQKETDASVKEVKELMRQLTEKKFGVVDDGAQGPVAETNGDSAKAA
ncbi:Putative mediator of RNA polymerase II transcription subunit 22 [Septoria linicola]|uniref:Mediator of RNA polymerase II transcription subunit 22 n=1 Tax=Septoria linicola TaxID=215465 RepID=A0A9Q9EK17_9PEZI|nr:putative mediator of RNA polymerase II transcription subunit 22 [Septoria linicola]USW52784.1 Putative mediator of RNA polymerase II transcription subunit 22 [Septoria linicola]